MHVIDLVHIWNSITHVIGISQFLRSLVFLIDSNDQYMSATHVNPITFTRTQKSLTRRTEEREIWKNTTIPDFLYLAYANSQNDQCISLIQVTNALQ